MESFLKQGEKSLSIPIESTKFPSSQNNPQTPLQLKEVSFYLGTFEHSKIYSKWSTKPKLKTLARANFSTNQSNNPPSLLHSTFVICIQSSRGGRPAYENSSLKIWLRIIIVDHTAFSSLRPRLMRSWLKQQ